MMLPCFNFDGVQHFSSGCKGLAELSHRNGFVFWTLYARVVLSSLLSSTGSR